MTDYIQVDEKKVWKKRMNNKEKHPRMPDKEKKRADKLRRSAKKKNLKAKT